MNENAPGERELSLEEEGYIEDADQSDVRAGSVRVYNPHLDKGTVLTEAEFHEIESTKNNREERNKLTREEILRPEMSAELKQYKEHEEEMRQRGFVSAYASFEDGGELGWKLVDPEANAKWKAEHADLLKERKELEAKQRRELSEHLVKEEARKGREKAEVAQRTKELQEQMAKTEMEKKQKRDARIAGKAAAAGISSEEYEAQRRAESPQQ
ncbi:MAG: hypothetical protein A3D65_03860 [Candidatus Lloydbacteria bacterium RIFCSPHIGHO2_02_FULL_50_13]|uniref:Uncharacterized protein n=1 Tax=Candidatus Lloydbacteria bacterium RIFCSPHIGHO2_02_FULL_50_13 TaxID=1798661 RepID=A0A1G2D3Z1_9BACT|nr:MAG: hypothetical protein A3D65_03860 [Candidatus Lloydbacteria bacterium RIFCSPHIGHO2_02_FULL_50_13]